MSLIDPDAAWPQGNSDNTGPATVQVLLHEATDLAACVDDQGGIDEIAVIEVLNRYDRLRHLLSDVSGQQARLTALRGAVNGAGDFTAY